MNYTKRKCILMGGLDTYRENLNNIRGLYSASKNKKFKWKKLWKKLKDNEI